MSGTTSKRASHLALTLWAAACSLAAFCYIWLHRAPLTSGREDAMLSQLHETAGAPAQILFLLTVTSPIPLMFAAISGLRRDAQFMFWLRVALLMTAPWVMFTASRQVAWWVTRTALQRAAMRARPLISAIEAHETRHGFPPKRLDELGMNVPTTGIRGYPKYEYARSRVGESRTEAWWYDLGFRSGRSLTHRWRSADGNLAHAVLVAHVDGQGLLIDLFADRMPVQTPNAPFDPQSWKSRQKRISMVSSLLTDHQLTHARELTQLLGAPDGKRLVRDAAWQLNVATSPRELESEGYFFYWPSGQYPNHVDGSPVRRMGRWAYVVR